MNLDLYLIPENASLRDALKKIEANHHGFILSINANGQVMGLATDGDIRRKLLEGVPLEAPLSQCSNPKFVWADPHSPRELLLKQLDHMIRIIPILDEQRRLVGIFNRNNLPVLAEEKIYARARAPVRISFGGGGSDLTRYFAGDFGAVINSTISLYSHATLRKREDSKIIIHSKDLGQSFEASSLKEALEKKSDFGLIQALIRTIHPDFGFELYLHSDFPMGSGLGGSAVVSAAVIGCFNQFRQDKWDLHEIAELAFQAERLYLEISGGWQDQYATVFGGFNFMEFRMDQNIVHPLRLPADTQLELEESLVLCDTGEIHQSDDVHQDQRKQLEREDIRAKVQENVELTYRIRNHLLRGRLNQFGLAMNEAWQLKRQFSSKISNERLDGIYTNALKNGALGGKLLGAGAGGFFIFFVPPFKKFELISALEKEGLTIKPFRFESEGLRTWSVREKAV